MERVQVCGPGISYHSFQCYFEFIGRGPMRIGLTYAGPARCERAARLGKVEAALIRANPALWLSGHNPNPPTR
jgi:hypothetical protein